MREVEAPSDTVRSDSRVGYRVLGQVPIYFAVFAAWWALGMLVLAIRIPIAAWTPLVELFWWQALLSDKMIGGWPRWVTGLLWLVVYTLFAAIACVLWERVRQGRGRVWLRALASSILFQTLILLLAFKLAPE